MKAVSKRMGAAQLLLLAFFVIAVILPVARMLVYMVDTDVAKLLTSDSFTKALLNSLAVSATTTLIAVLLAWGLAWCVVRSNIRFKGLFAILFILPMLIPSISHGMGLVVLFGANGVVTNLLSLSSNIYGFWGIVIGSLMYSFPVAYLMISEVLRFEDSSPYEAAVVLGISKPRQITAIAFPYLRKPLVVTAFAVFTLVITDYGVPLMVGGQYTTLPVMLYQDVIGLLDFGKGSAIGMVLLIPAVISFLIDLLNKDKGNTTYVTKPFRIAKNTPRDVFATIVCFAVGLFVLLPIVAFAILTFVKKYPSDMSFTLDNITRTFNMQAGTYLANSLLIAVCVAAIGVVVAIVTAYLTARVPGRLPKSLHLFSITSLAIPGIVLGLSYVLFFKGSFIYGTLAILMLVNMVHFFASPYLMMYNAFSKMNKNLEAVGATLGVSRLRIILDVFLPQTKSTIAEMFSYFFVNSMMTISAVSFLATVSTRPLSLMITTFEAQMMLEGAAFVSLLILAINLLLKGGINLYKSRMQKKEAA
ncbi:ABC transporter permease subunit [Christensenellaceae bacterium OttesenSCG-928-K19]|nr:ABC transporter permease subunit [Christensenellaceae bacterium OttesenSCG-928-K19]